MIEAFQDVSLVKDIYLTSFVQRRPAIELNDRKSPILGGRLVGEVGEFHNATRNINNFPHQEYRKDIEQELADVFMTLFAVEHAFGFNVLDQATMSAMRYKKANPDKSLVAMLILNPKNERIEDDTDIFKILKVQAEDISNMVHTYHRIGQQERDMQDISDMQTSVLDMYMWGFATAEALRISLPDVILEKAAEIELRYPELGYQDVNMDVAKQIAHDKSVAKPNIIPMMPYQEFALAG